MNSLHLFIAFVISSLKYQVPFSPPHNIACTHRDHPSEFLPKIPPVALL